MISPDQLGRTFGPYTFPVERGRISRFAAAIGELSPIYHHLATAQAAGLPDLPAPPTLATCYGLWANQDLLAALDSIGAPLPRQLHGEQHYSFHAPVYAGDTLTSSVRLVGLEQKRGKSGPFQLITLETRLHNQRGQLAIIDRLVSVLRGDEGEAAAVANAAAPTRLEATSADTPLADADRSGHPFDEVRVGEVLPELEAPALVAADFVYYAEASNDYNPLHTDDAHARSTGLDGVIAHGMLVMGHMGRVATGLAGPQGLRAFSTRFRGQTRPGDALRFGGTVSAAYERDGQAIVETELWARVADGSLRASATLVAALPRRK
jgi:acyl dehydratase